MKKFKKLIPAMVMLLIAAMLMGTTTYAWFSMNTTVTATGMKVKARAESGLLICEVSATTGTWDNSATGGTTTPYALIPMSTANGSTWFHANSKVTGSSASATSSAYSVNLVGGAYETPTLVTNTTTANDAVNAAISLAYVDKDGVEGYDDSIDQGAYVKYTFYLKSSAEEITCGNTNVGDQYVEITSIKVEGLSSSKDLDAALRVAVKVGTKFYVYAPISDSTNTYYVGTSRTEVTTEALATGSELTADGTAVYNTVSDLATLPAFTAAGTPAEVYIWIEGEDANCISDNVKATLDSLSIEVNFSLKTKTA